MERKVTPQRCKGYRDLLPGDMVRFRRIEEVFRSCCIKWGYQEIRTPTLEYLHLFTSAGTLTPEMLSQVYSFLDWNGWSGERVVLRPEGTIPAARLYLDNLGARHFARIFYVENVFRFEETGREPRERWQCGAELIGDAQPAADVELILLASEVLERLGWKEVELHLSHAGLLRALAQELGAEESQIVASLLKGEWETMKGMAKDNPRLRDSLPLLLELRGRTPGFLRNLSVSLGRDLPRLKPFLEEFTAIAELLSLMERNYQIDITAGRGFEYYTGAVFQFYLQGRRVGGGGRYNDLFPLIGGKSIPASGFALYLDQLMELLPQPEEEAASPRRILVRNEGKEAEGWKLGFEVARQLREAGYIAQLCFLPQEEKDFPWVLLLREKEGRYRFLLRDQIRGRKKETASLAEVIKLLEKHHAQAGAA